jgi:GH18 family chitinase
MWRRQGLVSYWDIAQNMLTSPRYERAWNDVAKVPYLVGMDKFISYDDEQSIGEKVGYAKRQQLGGLAMWEASEDPNGLLLVAANNAWASG